MHLSRRPLASVRRWYIHIMHKTRRASKRIDDWEAHGTVRGRTAMEATVDIDACNRILKALALRRRIPCRRRGATRYHTPYTAWKGAAGLARANKTLHRHYWPLRDTRLARFLFFIVRDNNSINIKTGTTITTASIRVRRRDMTAAAGASTASQSRDRR